MSKKYLISYKMFKIFINRDICILDRDIGIMLKKSKDCDIHVHNLRRKCQIRHLNIHRKFKTKSRM